MSDKSNNSARLRTAKLLLLGGLLATSCATSAPGGPPSAPSAEPPTSATNAIQEAAHETCARFAVAALSVDAATDRGPADARRRAAHEYGTPTLTVGLAGEGRDTDWTLLGQHHAWVTVTTDLAVDDLPLPDGGLVAAAVIAHRTAVSNTGWRHDLPSTVVYCTLTHTADGWRITDITLADSAASGVIS